MKLPLYRLLPLCIALPLVCQAAVTEEKIIFVRHGEKPAQGLGQLECQGLNRALALPAVIVGKFGKPDFVFASNPHDMKKDGGKAYYYVRPLLTVGPTAVALGLPINVGFGYDDIQGMQTELAEPRYHNATVLVAWEHSMLEAMVKAILPTVGGDVADVPKWKGSDFDSMYVLTVRRDGATTTAKFAVEHEQLNGLSSVCPGPALSP